MTGSPTTFARRSQGLLSRIVPDRRRHKRIAVELLGRLVACDSTVGREAAAQEIVAAELARLGFEVRHLPIPETTAANLRRAKPELIHWPAKSGGFTIEGLLYLPPDATAGKIPLIVDVHGGPFGAFEDRNDAMAAFLVGQGWAVLRPNPRGSGAPWCWSTRCR